MDSTQSPSPIVRQNHSCVRCAVRKVKCDRKKPCGACVRYGLECIFQPPAPRSRRRPNVDTEALTDRLQQYEAWFRQRGIDPDRLPQPAQSPSESGSVQPQRIDQNVTDNDQSTPPAGERLARPTFSNNILWTRVAEEIDPDDDLDSTDSGSHTEIADANDTPDTAEPEAFLLLTGHWPSPSMSRARPAHPLPDMVRKMWQIYCNSINPLTKLLHVPTVQKMVDSAVSDTASLSRASEALLFAIYAAAVMSLQEDICHDTLGEQRSVLLPQYLATTEAALARAGVLGTSDMVVLQAFLVYLLAVRDRYTPRAVWTLTGVAMRIAKSMGLDRDGQSSGLSPFDIEMRRRLWWQLRMHDFRTAELCGRPKFEGLVEMDSPVLSNMSSFPTQWPANVNDADLSPDMPGPPFPPLGEASTATDAIFVAVKCELLRFTAQRLAKMQRSRDQNESPWTLYSSLAEDGNLQTLENHLETRYLRYCDPSRPLHLMATLMVRCALNILRFMARHPRRPLPETSDDDRRTTFNLCLAILDQQNLLQSNPHLRTFAWHAPFFQQWHALLHVLDTLRADPSMGQATRAWDLLGKTYANNAEMQTPRKTVHIVVGKLCLQAWEARRAALVEGNQTKGTPPFIVGLRQAREARKSKEQTAASVQTGTKPSTVQGTPNTQLQDSLFMGMDDDPTVGLDWEQWDTWLGTVQ